MVLAMRDRIVQGLNELLEIDHDSVAAVMTAEITLSPGSDLKAHPAAYASQGVRVVSALTIINQCLDAEPVRARFEDGVIQCFE